MSEPKDNPAPWTIHEHSWCDTSISDANGETVCSLSIEDECTEENQEEWEANMAARACLLVAAPDMLDALILAKSEFEKLEGAGTCPLEIEDAIEMALGTNPRIAKAKGESN